jgi:hypothetical protein
MLSADVDQIGTGADCPSCEAELTVPFMFGAVLDPDLAAEVYAAIPWKERADVWLKSTVRFILRFGRLPGADPDDSLADRYAKTLDDGRIHLVGMHQIAANLDIAVQGAKAYVRTL